MLEHFVAGATARCASKLVNVNKNTTIFCFRRLREMIVHQLEQESSEVFEGEIAVDESYFPGTQKGNRGRGEPGSAHFWHFWINHLKYFADKKNHINSIKNFWNQAKRHLRKFKGVPKDHFLLFLKECEWRFNNSDPQIQLSQLKQYVQRMLA